MRADALNAGLLALTLAAAVWFATLPGEVVPPRAVAHGFADAPAGPDATEVVDARGNAVPVAPYRRIVSLNTISDQVLLELVEPERLLAITGYTSTEYPESWRFGARPAVQRSEDIEAVVALQPDLVVVSRFANEAYMERLRESGIRVFDLGEMLGVETMLANVRALGALLDVPERAERLEKELVRQLLALDTAVPEAARLPGIYLTVYADHVSGGTAGTAYADVLRYGGVRDLAAEHGFRNWPQYGPEELRSIDPPLIVTSEGMADAIRAHSLLRDLRACGPDGRILEIPGAYLGDPGLGLIEAARRIQEALHPTRAPTHLPEPPR